MGGLTLARRAQRGGRALLVTRRVEKAIRIRAANAQVAQDEVPFHEAAEELYPPIAKCQPELFDQRRTHCAPQGPVGVFRDRG